MVPVGGSIVYSSNKIYMEKLANLYPGRCSINSVLDLFMTLLEMGIDGYKNLIEERERLFIWFKQEVSDMAIELGESLLVN
jgi:O-phospho-L-seryl-tRNASec:L-selenocysteinyl-tRNA synthase